MCISAEEAMSCFFFLYFRWFYYWCDCSSVSRSVNFQNFFPLEVVVVCCTLHDHDCDFFNTVVW